MASKKKSATGKMKKAKKSKRAQKIPRASTKAPSTKTERAALSSKKRASAGQSSHADGAVSTVVVKQRSDYQGNDWWNWSVWIEAPEKQLDQIQYVEYTLHPTFAERVRRVTDRGTKFRLDSAGWGEFMIGVEVQEKDQHSFKRQHWLTLDYPEETAKASRPEPKEKKERPAVYLSGSISDLNFSTVLAKSLEVQGFEVLKKEDAPADLPWDRVMTLLIEQADLIVMLISGGLTSWGKREMDMALSRKLPIVSVVIGQATVPEPLQAFKTIPLKDVSDPVKIAPQVSAQIKEAIHR